MLVVKINNTDRTSQILLGTITITDQLNQNVDNCSLALQRIVGTSKAFKPEVGQEIVIEEDATRIFAGVLVDISETVQSSTEIRYDVKCKDYTHLLDGKLVVDRYEDMTVTAIIADMVSQFAPSGFTTTNVNCPIIAKTVVFNRISFSSALEKLSKLTGYSWYVDYNKNIFFFEKNTIPSPFGLKDDDSSYIFESLVLNNDISQLRNRVYVRGGEAKGSARTEVFSWDGTKKTFTLGNKFATKPTVTVNGSGVTVGVDYLDDEASFNCLWNYNEKYIKFSTAYSATNGTNNIVVNGVPLFPIQVQVEDPVSISKYGTFEYSKKDLTIKSKEEALKIAQTELQAYSATLDEGNFDTYSKGLRSGQILKVQSNVRAIDENFLVQKVVAKQLTINKMVYKVTLASLRTVGIIDLLISLLRSEDRYIDDTSDETIEKSAFSIETIKMSDVFISTLSGILVGSEVLLFSESFVNQGLDYNIEFVYGDFTPTGTKRVFVLNGSPLG